MRTFETETERIVQKIGITEKRKVEKETTGKIQIRNKVVGRSGKQSASVKSGIKREKREEQLGTFAYSMFPLS